MTCKFSRLWAAILLPVSWDSMVFLSGRLMRCMACIERFAIPCQQC